MSPLRSNNKHKKASGNRSKAFPLALIELPKASRLFVPRRLSVSVDGLKALRLCIYDATAMGEAWKIKHRWGYEELNNNGCLLFVAMTYGGIPCFYFFF